MADEVQCLRLVACTIDAGTEPLFNQLARLNRVLVRDTPVPETWVRALTNSKIEKLVVIGDCGKLSGERIARLLSDRAENCLLTVDICNGRTTTSELKHWNAITGACTFRAIAGLDMNLPESGVALSEPDLEASEAVSAIVTRLHKLLNGLDPPARNEFNPPAPDDDIVKLESLLGIPLHPTFRAYLKLHNGQPSESDELIAMERLLPIDRIIEDYNEWNCYFEPEEAEEYDFDPDYDSWVNPNVLPIGTSEDHVIGVHLLSGQIVHWYSEQRELDYHADSLVHYFQIIADKIEAGELEYWDADRPNGDWHNKVTVSYPPLILRGK